MGKENVVNNQCQLELTVNANLYLTSEEVIMILCRKCQSGRYHTTDEEQSVCLCCGAELEFGLVYCESCSSKLQLCQHCGEPLRLSDFANVFACGQDGRELPKAVERRIIAMMLAGNY